MRKGEERRMLDDLTNCPDLSVWEDDFLYSLAQQLDLSNQLTPKQLTKLTEIHERRVFGLLVID